MKTSLSVAYFSMEIGLESPIPTYSGGLGVLAGDTLRSAADASLSMAGITLLSRKGYFRQRLNMEGWQIEESVNWPIDDYLELTDNQIQVEIEDRQVAVRAWRYDIKGLSGHIVPVYLLDTDVPGNTDYDRTLTDFLYGGDRYYRLCQEVILGIGGVRMLRSLGYSDIERFHMNEGHPSLLVFERMAELTAQNGSKITSMKHIEQVRRECVFTTHTPVVAGHDRFPMDLAFNVLKRCNPMRDCGAELCCDNELNLTHLALSASHYINGVAKKHREISQKMFGDFVIDSITNGVHAHTWAAEPMHRLFDTHIPDWRQDNAGLRYAISIDFDEIWQAHLSNKHRLIEYVNKVCNAGFDQNIMTLGFARRATEYKRPTLVFADLERLRAVAKNAGSFQIVFSGKAHPKDQNGKQLIHDIIRIKNELNSSIRIAYIPDYDMDIGRMVTSGVDLWLNTPKVPMEASGTSGMKAALNGVPSLSVLDGWWIEGCIEGVTGWAITPSPTSTIPNDGEAETLYRKLEQVIIPMYYHQREKYIEIMRHAIAINASFFNTERMMSQYVTKAYFA